MLELTLSTFQPHVGSIFQLLDGGQPALELTLVQVEDLTLKDALRDPELRAQPFSLIFHGPVQPIAIQAIQSLRHVTLPPLEIFLVPLGPDRKNQVMRYQAIFN